METMNKKEAMERLSSIEEETKQLRKIIEKADEPKNIMERVKTFEDACNVLGISPTFSHPYPERIKARLKLEIIFLALNEGWKPDWSNSNEYKYYPYFEMSPFGFADSAYVTWATASTAGSRLCGKTDTIAQYAGRQFEDLYKIYLTE